MKPKKKGADPKPPKDSDLRKIYINQVKGLKAKDTFWMSNEKQLLEGEKKIQIEWDTLLDDFKDVAKNKKQGKAKAKKVEEEFDTVLASDTRTRVEISLTKFGLTIEEVKSKIGKLNATYDEITRIYNILLSEEVRYQSL